jgi:hypothetical protein
VAAGLALQFAGLGAIGACALKYGNAASIPAWVVAVLCLGAVLEMAGAVVISSAFARSRVTFVLFVPVAVVLGPLSVLLWPWLWLVGSGTAGGVNMTELLPTGRGGRRR